MDDPTADSDVAAFIKAARKRMAKTLEAFGEEFGRTKANVHAWERGLHEPPFSLLAEISRRSGVPLPTSATAASAPSAPASAPPWPLRRLTPEQWEAIDPYDRAVIEDAALTKLRALEAERRERPAAPSRKRPAAGTP